MAIKLLSPGDMPGECAVALGNFDGVHPGHAALLKMLVEDAGEKHLLPLVWTFRRRPQIFLSPGVDPGDLIPFSEKAERMEKIGVQALIAEDFARVRDLSPEAFCRRILLEQLSAREVLCGFNFRFGKNGAGNSAFLKNFLEKEGVAVRIAEKVALDGETVSSTVIRQALLSGNVEKAARFLGRCYAVCRPVEEGKKLGRTLGFPTANQTFAPGSLIPRHGVYAVWARIGTEKFPGVCNIGSRPSFADGEKVNLETHLLGFSGDLYGKEMKLEFVSFLREERCFAAPEELREQIKKDVLAAQKALQ